MQMAYQSSRTVDDTDRTLWMGDLNPQWDLAFIEEAFARMGEEVSNVKIVFDKHAGKQAGYCFVEFVDRESARRAMLHINGKIIPKSKPAAAFNLSFANSPNAPYTEYNLFVNNVPQDMDDAALFLIFGERYESCRGAKVYRNTDGSSKGLGFVRFSDQTDQQRALLEMNKYRVDGKQLILKLAQPKYRAPRQPRHLQQQASPYDNYQYRSQEQNAVPYYASIAPSTPSLHTAQYAAQYNYTPVEPQIITQTQYYPSAVASTTTCTKSGGDIEPIVTETAEESNDRLLDNSEEFYDALEKSQWSKVILTPNITDIELLNALS